MSSPVALAQKAASTDSDKYRAVQQALSRGQISTARDMVAHITDPLYRKLATGSLMAAPDTPFSFKDINAFISDNPWWPEQDLLRQRAEERIDSAGLSEAQQANWFSAHPPLTLAGFDIMIAALRSTGQADKIPGAIRARWINGSFGSDEQRTFLARYGTSLRSSDHWARTDRLLWSNTAVAAGRMLPLLPPGQAALAKARLNFNKKSLAKVPAALRRDPGLVYLQLRAARQQDRDDEAAALLNQQPTGNAHADDWWNARNIIARRFLLAGKAQRAYQLAAQHRLHDGMAWGQAEFLAGWIALRFLDNPDKARPHFARLYEKSNFPISKARAAYWLGRCDDATAANTNTNNWYRKAALFPTTFYGQLALTALENDSTLTIAAPIITKDARDEFSRREPVRLITLLSRMGERTRVAQFTMAFAADLTDTTELTLLAQLANRLERYDLAVRISKRATQRGMLLQADAYPLPDYLLREAPEPALVLGLTRQESMFDPEIVSPAQAVGLMQLLPSTGRETARRLGLSFSAGQLTDPNYNIRLGSRFLADRIAQFDGALPLAIASYNAGPARVRQWMEKIGDPRRGRDPIDWIELIPVYETRNYVQRVLEATQIYRARLQKGSAPLRLRADLGLP